MKYARNLFDEMTSLHRLFSCWDQFRRGKRKREDIQYFERHLEDHIFQLREDLISFQYKHAPYSQFYVTDPKQRHISKATVRDRLVHHVLYDTLTTVLDNKFLFHSLSCRIGKGTHVGISLLRRMIRKVSMNGKLPCYALKMDIRRFFDSVDHSILKRLLRARIADEKVLKLTDTVIDSFTLPQSPGRAVGLPLGNVTSQLFANLYLHELDDFIKHDIQQKYYLRYCDDFIILSTSEEHLKALITPIREFLAEQLRLELHPHKVTIRKLSQGIDFVGYVLFEHHALMRTRSKQRMQKRLSEAYEHFLIGAIDQTPMDKKVQSYLGILSHANQHTLSQAIQNAYGVRSKSPFSSPSKNLECRRRRH